MRVAAGSTDQSVFIRIVDSTDGTPETGVTSASGGLALGYYRMVAGASFVGLTESDLAAVDTAHTDGGMIHINAGYYRVDIPDAAFASGAARVLISGAVTGMVVIGVVVEIGAGQGIASEIQNGLATSAALQVVDDNVDTLVASITTTAAIVDAVWDEATAGHTTSGTFGEQLKTDVDAILADTGTDGVVVNAAGLAADAVTEIQSGLATAANLATAQTAIDDIPTNAELATALAAADDAVLAAVAALNDLSATDVENAVWDAVLADHLDSGSTGAGLNAAGGAGDPWSTALPGAYGAGSAGKIIGDNINATISSRATQTSVDDLPTNAELATSQAAADDATLAAIAALNNLSAAQVNAEVDTAISDAALATAANLATAQTAINDIPTNAELATALGTADDAVLAAIAALNNLSAAAVNAEVDTALADYDAPTHAELSTALAAADDAVLAAIAALNNLSAAQVNAEMLDVLTTDTFAEPGAVPAATSSLEDKISWLFTLARNKITQTATTQTLRNDADSADIATSTVSDDGTTAIRGEFS